MTRSPSPPPYAPPDAEPLPRLTPEIVQDDDELAEAVDLFVFLDPEARARLGIITLHQDALRVADPESWPLYLRTDELMTERWADLVVLISAWAFKEGRRFPIATPETSNVSPDEQSGGRQRGGA